MHHISNTVCVGGLSDLFIESVGPRLQTLSLCAHDHMHGQKCIAASGGERKALSEVRVSCVLRFTTACMSADETHHAACVMFMQVWG